MSPSTSAIRIDQKSYDSYCYRTFGGMVRLWYISYVYLINLFGPIRMAAIDQIIIFDQHAVQQKLGFDPQKWVLYIEHQLTAWAVPVPHILLATKEFSE